MAYPSIQNIAWNSPDKEQTAKFVDDTYSEFIEENEVLSESQFEGEFTNPDTGEVNYYKVVTLLFWPA